MGDVLVVAEQLDGALGDITFEMLGQARKLAGELGGQATVALVGGASEMVGQLGEADKVYTVEADANFNPETHLAAVRAVIDSASPQLVMIGSTAMGMDLAAGLSVGLGRPLAAYCIEVSGGGGRITTTCQLYGGKMNVSADLGAGPCLVSVIPGSFPAEAGRKAGEPAAEAVAAPAPAGKVRFKQMIMPEAGDVDITTHDVLVAVGRGIGKKEDIEVADDLAKALNAAVAASRPVIDAGWLPKSRQVGKSGLKVTPKVYIALGISGAPEHIEGMKSSATIIAINTDKNAPIFDVAHYGVVGDLFDLCEEIVDELG